MISAYTADEVRTAEQPLLAAGEPLMLRAAAALAETSRAMLADQGATPGRVLVLVGPGANGGDGLHAAALLRRRGVDARALLVLGEPHAGGAEAFARAGGELERFEEAVPCRSEAPEAGHVSARLDGVDLILDAVLGIGGRAEAPEPLHPLLEEITARRIPVLAVDAPSFVDTTTGAADPHALRAERTCTFGAAKRGLLLAPTAHLVGRLQVVDIGLERHLPAHPALQRLESADVAAAWRAPGPEDTKYTRGVVALLAGSDPYPGAAVLTSSAAVRTGAGMVRDLGPRRVLDLVLAARPEVVTHPADGAGWSEGFTARTDALVVGPGTAPEDDRLREAVQLLADGTRIARGVIDAGALGAIAESDRFTQDVVLTPHRGEAERLSARLGIDPQQAPDLLAAALAEATGATCLLKGSPTLVIRPDGTGFSQADGSGALATAGTGDVLAGILGALLARGLPGPEAAATAALLHGRAGALLAGEHDRRPLAAGDLPAAIPAVWGTILAASTPLTRGEG